MILSKKSVYSLTSLCLFVYTVSIVCTLFMIVNQENGSVYQIIMTWLPFLSSLVYCIIMASFSFDMYKIKVKRIVVIEVLMQFYLLLHIIFMKDIQLFLRKNTIHILFMLGLLIIVVIHIIVILKINRINNDEIETVQDYILNYHNDFFENKIIKKNIHFSYMINVLMIVFLDFQNELVYILIVLRFILSIAFCYCFKKFNFDKKIIDYFYRLFLLEIIFFVGIVILMIEKYDEIAFLLMILSCFKIPFFKEKIMMNDFKKSQLMTKG